MTSKTKKKAVKRAPRREPAKRREGPGIQPFLENKQSTLDQAILNINAMSIKLGGPEIKYKPEMCQQLFDHMGEGLSFETFGAVVGVSKDTLYRWCRDNATFRNARDQGRLACQMRLEKQSNTIAMGGCKGNAVMQLFRIKNLTTWREDPALEEDEVEDITFG